MTEVKTVPIEQLIENAGNQTVSGSLDQILSGQSEILDHLKWLETEKSANKTEKKDLDQLEKSMKAFGKALSNQIDASRNTHAMMLKNHNEMMKSFYEYKKTIGGKVR